MKSITILILTAAILYGCKPSQEAPALDENRIISENKNDGTTSWLINVAEKHCSYPDHQFCRRPQIEGFCSKNSYVAGDTLSIFVSTEPSKSYSIDLYRMGYYQGKGGRLMKSIGPLQGRTQNVPKAEKNNLVECRWDTAYSMVIPPSWLSGVYLGKLTASDSSQSYIVFTLKDDRQADLLFQSSDMTWQAYNRWPYWHAMYDEGQKPWVNTDGARISFDRPYGLYVNLLPSDFNGLSNGSGEFLLWEFPLCFWLEKKGYDVTYITNTDTHADAKGLLRGKAFLSVGHDEYWTPQMVDNVKTARDHGVNILFLSGNSVSGAVYLDQSSDGRPNRITGRLVSDRFLNEPEIMGSTSYGVGYGDIVLKNTDHWIYEGTGITEGDTLKDLVGWEYHGYPLKEDTTLIVLGTCKIKPNKFADDNPPDHAMTLYTAAKGNFVFNAGTCFWNLPLATPPGSQKPVNNQGDQGKMVIDFTKGNPTVERMTKNLLDRAVKKDAADANRK